MSALLTEIFKCIFSILFSMHSAFLFSVSVFGSYSSFAKQVIRQKKKKREKGEI